jgi:hypothetical protein
MTPENPAFDVQPSPEQRAAAPELIPSDYATGFVAGYLRAQGVARQPTIPEFREALAELTSHLDEVRHAAH